MLFQLNFWMVGEISEYGTLFHLKCIFVNVHWMLDFENELEKVELC